LHLILVYSAQWYAAVNNWGLMHRFTSKLTLNYIGRSAKSVCITTTSRTLTSELALVALAACRKHLVGCCQCKLTLLRGSCHHSVHRRRLGESII